jgi:hypothetical protein
MPFHVTETKPVPPAKQTFTRPRLTAQIDPKATLRELYQFSNILAEHLITATTF